MKGLNVKKLAAIGIGAALVGTALAPIASAIDLTKSDVVSAQGQLQYDVVVGPLAAVSDVVWAGNIAAKLAQLATTTSKPAVDFTISEATEEVTDEVTEEVTEEVAATDATVSITVGGKKTVTGGKTYKDNLTSDTTTAETNFLSQTVTHDTLTHLVYNGSKDFTCQGTAYNSTMQEKITFTVNPEFKDTVTGSGTALAMKVSSTGLQYVLDLGSGIYDNEQCTTAGTTNYSDDSNDNVRIPWFGSEYLVDAYDRTNKILTLIKSSGDKIYAKGDVIKDLKGKDGKLYSLQVDAGATSGSVVKIYLTLLDSEGKVVSSSKGYETSTSAIVFYNDDTGAQVLETLVTLKEILTKTTDAGGTYYEARMLVGTDKVQIKDGAGYPYDTSKKEEEYIWDAAVTTASGKLTQVAIRNKSNNIWVGSSAYPLLKVGEEVKVINDYASIKFLGFQLPEFSAQGVSSVESVSSFTLGNEQLVYKDATYEATHTLPFYKRVDSVVDDQTGSFTLDGKAIWWKINLTNLDLNLVHNQGTLDFNGSLDINAGKVTEICSNNGFSAKVCDTNTDSYITVGDNTFAVSAVAPSNRSGLSIDTNTWADDWITVTADGNITFRKDSSTGDLIADRHYDDQRAMDANYISFAGQSEITHQYTLLVDESSTEATFWLMLNDQNFTTQHTKYLSLKGTDTDESGDLGNEANYSHYFYEPDDTSLPTDYNGGGGHEYHYKVAQWVFFEDGTRTGLWDMNFFINTTTGSGDLISLPNQFLSDPAYGVDYSYEVDYNAGGNGNADWHLREDDASMYIKEGYTDYGTKVTLADHVATVTFPENRPKVEVLLSGTGTLISVDGEPKTGLKKGDLFTTTAGTSVVIDDIVGAGTTTTTTTGITEEDITYTVEDSVTIVPVDQLVYVAGETLPAGNHVIVGGYFVNPLAEDVVLADGTTLMETLAIATDMVVEKLENGDIIVAGYTAADTKAAAKELIAALEDLI